jgi:membrane protease YdiL (CAAX protease family)
MTLGFENMLFSLGLALFGIWLLRTTMGRHALDQAPIRRTNMHPLLVLAAIVMWQVPPVLMLSLMNPLLSNQPEWIVDLVEYMIITVGACLAIIGFCVLAWLTFAQRLKGFGLRLHGLHKDFGKAVLILFCLQPLVLSMVVATDHIGKWFKGADYEMGLHEGLETLQQHPQPLLQVAVVMTAVLVAPIVEEMLFRGFLQTLFRSYVSRPWLSIAMGSLLFVTVHSNSAHWPALFVLSMGMGYAYEQSGSLWQPIFIHMLFNGTAVIPYLL